MITVSLIKSVKLEQVIKITYVVGKGSKDEPYKEVTSYFNIDGRPIYPEIKPFESV